MVLLMDFYIEGQLSTCSGVDCNHSIMIISVVHKETGLLATIQSGLKEGVWYVRLFTSIVVSDRLSLLFVIAGPGKQNARSFFSVNWVNQVYWSEPSALSVSNLAELMICQWTSYAVPTVTKNWLGWLGMVRQLLRNNKFREVDEEDTILIKSIVELLPAYCQIKLIDLLLFLWIGWVFKNYCWQQDIFHRIFSWTTLCSQTEQTLSGNHVLL